MILKTPSVDILDAQGCNIVIDTQGAEVMRILPRVNDDEAPKKINTFSVSVLSNRTLFQNMAMINKSSMLVKWRLMNAHYAQIYLMVFSFFFIDIKCNLF